MVVPCGGPKSLPVHSFNALIILILRGCLQSLFNINDGPDIKLFILVGLGRSFFVCCLAHRGSTVGFLLLQCSSGVVRHPRDLQVSVATHFSSLLKYLSVICLFHVMIH